VHDRLRAVAVDVRVTEMGVELRRTGIDRTKVEPPEPTHAVGAQRFDAVHPASTRGGAIGPCTDGMVPLRFAYGTTDASDAKPAQMPAMLSAVPGGSFSSMPRLMATCCTA
jgi:hypothetical protein